MRIKHLPLKKVLAYTLTGLFLCVAVGIFGIVTLSNNENSPPVDTSHIVSSDTTDENSLPTMATGDSSEANDSSSLSEDSSEVEQGDSNSVTSESVDAISSDAVTSDSASSDVSSSESTDDSEKDEPQNVVQPNVPPVSDEYRAMWISYLELEGIDMSNTSSFTSEITKMLDNMVETGLNTVIFHVRPFGDALYDSDIFPTSHLITGTQGDDLPYDPLQIVLELSHARGLKVEAWINPYRAQLSSSKPGNLAGDNPAVEFMNTAGKDDYVVEANGGLYYNPAYTEVQQLIVDGVLEIINKYDVDGIQFDDYFYPTTEASFDAEAYAELGAGKDLAAWRRENVNSLVRSVYDAVKRTKPSVYFGISPQGNNSNNYNSQYSDVNLWLSTPGYVDYIMPQLYWGFDYLTSSGRTDYQFAKLSAEWESYTRAPSVELYIGLGAYRIGVGDGGSNDQTEWSTGRNLSEQVTELRTNDGIGGFALYRYDSLYNSESYALAEAENEALMGILN